MLVQFRVLKDLFLIVVAQKDEQIELLTEQLDQQSAHIERLAETLERKMGAEERQVRICHCIL